MADRLKSCVYIATLGEYINYFQPDEQIHIVADDFYIKAPVYVLRSELRSLLKFEVTYNEYFPNTVYI